MEDAKKKSRHPLWWRLSGSLFFFRVLIRRAVSPEVILIICIFQQGVCPAIIRVYHIIIVKMVDVTLRQIFFLPCLRRQG